MSELKIPIGKTVLDASIERIQFVFDNFPKIYLSFSAGKDSSVMLHLVMAEAIKRNRKIGLLLIDLEAQYKLTIGHALDLFTEYKDYIEPYWVALPMSLRNAVSQYQPQWMCWEPGKKDDWVRSPPDIAITDTSYFPFFKVGMEFEDFIDEFGHWYGKGDLTACFVGIRCDESLNRFRAIASKKKTPFEGKCWTTWKSRGLYNIYPIYDWRTKDIWIYNGKFGKKYNHLYDRMQMAGLSIHQQRICQPYGDDQKKGLWLYHLIEPETWGRVVARVNGANSGALYTTETGNISGNIKISLPEGHTWQSFAKLLLSSMPPVTRDHYEDKVAVFLKWYESRGFPLGIPDEGPMTKDAPSWKRICKSLLRNDYWCKGLSFTQHKSGAYEKYKKVMKKRRQLWNII